MCRRYSECTCGVGKAVGKAETRLGMRSLESGVIAEGTDSISAATCCWHQREGLLFCPRFRHSYIISSRSDLSHIFSFLELAFSIWTRSACRSDTTIPSEHAAACCCWPGAPSAVPSDVEQKTQAQPHLTHVYNNPNLCGSRERESRRDPAVTSGCSRLHAPCS